MSTDITVIEPNGRELVPAQPRMIRPIASPEEALEAWREFEALKTKLVTAEDIQHLQGKDFLKKSGFRKLAAAFGLSIERISEEREDIAGGAWLWRVTVRATAPNGRFADGVAGCASNERRMSHAEHDTYSTAYTRAANRAIGDLIGGGLVSAEEMKAEAPAPPSISRDQAEAVVMKFLDAIDDWAMTTTELLVPIVMARGDLRQAYRLIAAQRDAPQTVDIEPADDE